MENVFILNGGDLRVVEAFNTKNGYQHSEGVIIDGFTCIEDAISFCYEENYNIIYIQK